MRGPGAERVPAILNLKKKPHVVGKRHRRCARERPRAGCVLPLWNVSGLSGSRLGAGLSLASALLERRNRPNARRGQQVTELTLGKRSAPNVWLLRPTLPVLHVGRFAQMSVTD